MESLNQVPLFSWLKEEQTLHFNPQTLAISRHLESDAPKGMAKYRCVYSNIHSETELALFIQACAQPISLAHIVRQNGLHCVELCVNTPLDIAQFTQLSSIEALEVFVISETQAVLNRPGLLVMDMDSTAIEIECIDELAVMAGVGDAVAEVTERAMQGELDFEESLRARVAQLAGADQIIIQTLCDKLPLMPGLTEMVKELQSHGWRLVVASGGFTPFVGHLKQLLALDAAYANELVIENGLLTGQVTGEVVDAQFKADTVVRCANAWEIAPGQRLAIGDGANDIPMIEIADFGIAYHAKPKLEAAADVAINKLDLKVLPYLLQLV
ncbi:phosphoserine phosphatase SerB [Shewanella hanedai]|uniref:Phosphoserine phosphatase n=1 Tax=Shewanella hanedai TaxID=25 RepID=A0A553JFA9_SHEHA|nr:phosphoserine phosphatase SerB [Shewanella hanedai]TRY11144.1 phosphoserine phosphatase SerB [Shewanella hanedai]GGJ04039.1 phosphoserine phosphatase SerB [Shewanella hanedai]